MHSFGELWLTSGDCKAPALPTEDRAEVMALGVFSALPADATHRTKLLREAMNEIVLDYGDAGTGVEPVRSVIDGTAFFPGGHGLWRGREPRGPMPGIFPPDPIAFFGHNFDSVTGYRLSLKRQMESLGGITWRKLLVIMEASGIAEERAFFSNVYMGLQPKSSIGGLDASPLFKEQCREFLTVQLGLVQPAVIVTLGDEARAAMRSLMDDNKFIAISHPRSAVRHGKAEAIGYELKRQIASMGFDLRCFARDAKSD